MKTQVILLLLFVLISAGVKSEVVYIHSDQLGSVVATSNSLGQITSRTQYGPFGIPDDDSELQDTLGYTGHKQDSDTGLVYMQARYYDPVIGRFYSNDPVSFKNVHNFNRYTYANNNPYKYVDPDGRDASLYAKPAWAADPTDLVAAPQPISVNQLALNNAIGLATAVVGLRSLSGTVTSSVTKTSTLQANKIAGAAGEARTAAKLGDSVAGKQVSFKASDGSRSRADFVTKDGVVVETKTGGATLSSGQKSLQNDILSGNPVTPVGKNAEAAGLKPGEPVMMRDYKVDQQ